MLDLKGITLDEVRNRYPAPAQILGYDILMDVDEFHKPRVISTFQMCINSVLTLLLMKPGQYPSIPELGINIEQYLFEYADDKTLPDKITNEINEQCNRLQLAGVTVDCYISKINPSQPELIVEIKGTEYVTYKNEKPVAIYGISYDKLNRVYLRQYQANE